VRSGRILPRVREIEILRDEESAGSLRGGPHDIVLPPGEVLIRNRVDIETGALRRLSDRSGPDTNPVVSPNARARALAENGKLPER